ncbi:unnamed protein product, partial [marine sediment metagenome]
MVAIPKTMLVGLFKEVIEEVVEQREERKIKEFIDIIYNNLQKDEQQDARLSDQHIEIMSIVKEMRAGFQQMENVLNKLISNLNS